MNLQGCFLLDSLYQGERPQKKILCYGVWIHRSPSRIVFGMAKKMGVVFGKNGGDARGANEHQDMD